MSALDDLTPPDYNPPDDIDAIYTRVAEDLGLTGYDAEGNEVPLASGNVREFLRGLASAEVQNARAERDEERRRQDAENGEKHAEFVKKFQTLRDSFKAQAARSKARAVRGEGSALRTLSRTLPRPRPSLSIDVSLRGSPSAIADTLSRVLRPSHRELEETAERRADVTREFFDNLLHIVGPLVGALLTKMRDAEAPKSERPDYDCDDGSDDDHDSDDDYDSDDTGEHIVAEDADGANDGVDE